MENKKENIMKRPDIIPDIINVLPEEVYQDCHIKNTVNVTIKQLDSYVKQFPKDHEIILYCAHVNCDASAKAYKLLEHLGYTNIKAYKGGMSQWYQQRLPVEGPCNREYLHVNHKAEQEWDVNAITLEELKEKLNINS